MSHLEIWMLGVALAMDCLAISLATGVGARRWVWVPMMTMALSFGLFQGGMTILGFAGASLLSGIIVRIGPWVAASILLLLGLKMLHEGRESRRTSVPGRIPGLQDTLLMAVATSIDAFAVGVSLTCIHYTASRMIYPVAVISFCSWAISIAGLVAGIRAAQRISWPTEPAGGIVLIALACRIALTEWIDKWL